MIQSTCNKNRKDKLDEYDTHCSQLERREGRASMQAENQIPLNSKEIENADLRSALSNAGYHPEDDPHAQTAEWYKMDYEYAQPPVRFHSQSHTKEIRTLTPSSK
mgnify:FL=1